MSGSESLEFKSPAAFASVGAAVVAKDPEMADIVLPNLNSTARSLSFINEGYVTVTYRALAIPKDVGARPSADKVKFLDYYSAAFDGELLGCAHIKLGEPSTPNNMNAVCMEFDDAVQLPHNDPIPEDHGLFIPVLSVRAMSKQIG